MVSLLDQPNPELVDMTRRFGLPPLAAPVFTLTMADMVGVGVSVRRHAGSTARLLHGSQSTSFLFRSCLGVSRNQANVFTLIAGRQCGLPLWRLRNDRARRLSKGFQLLVSCRPTDTTVVITVLVLLGEVLELRARSRTGTRFSNCSGSRRKRRLIRHGEDLDVPLDELKIGDLYRVRPGEPCPSTASWPKGAAIDESMVTGGPYHQRKTGSRENGRHDQHDRCYRWAEQVGSCISPNRQDGRQPAEPRANSAAGGPDRGVSFAVVLVAVLAFVVWASGDRRLVGAALQRGGRAHHRLSLRPGPRHTDGHHGGHRPRRDGRRAREECRRARTPERVDTIVIDKTDADRGQAEADIDRRGWRRKTSAAPPRRWSCRASIRWPARFWPQHESAD